VVEVFERRAVAGFLFDQHDILAGAGHRVQVRFAGAEQDPQQRLRLGGNAGAADVHPSLVADEPRAGLELPLAAAVSEAHPQAAGEREGGLPPFEVVGEALLAINALTLDFTRLPRQRRAAPGGDIEIMHAPVANKAGAVVPDQIPVRPGDAPEIIGLGRRRAAPHLPVEAGRHRLRFEGPGIFGLVFRAGSGDLDLAQLAKVAVADQCAGLPELPLRPLPRARLEHAPVLPHGPANLLPLLDRYAQGLLAIKILAGRRRRRRHQRVPMVLRGDHHRVNIRPGD